MNAQIPVNNALKLILEKYAQLAMFENCDIKSPESADPAGDTPFHIAAYDGDIEAIKIMLPCISDINIKGDNGDSPLHYAIMNNKPEIVRLLILNGADVMKKNDYGDTPIDAMKDNEIFQNLLLELKISN